jgi:NADH dehydrogenase FAD-containing subunit
MKKLVIIGGGFAGSKIAKALENKFEVTLIDTKDYFEFTPGILPAIVDPECMREIRVLHTHYLKKAMVMTGRVQKISKNEVFLKNKKIPFDYLVIASGSRYSYPFREHEPILINRANQLRNHCNGLCAAEKILIIGGGFTGVELAADIVCKYPKKEITIVHSMDRLLERQPEKVSKYAEKFFKKKGVKIIFNELVKGDRNRIYTTNKGTKIESDMAFLCVGIVPNSEFMKKSFPRLLDKREHIKVDEFLHLKNHNNIFVAGDVTDIKEEKTAQSAQEHADVIIENLQRIEKNKPLKNYHFINKGMLISLGEHDGIMSKGNFVLTGKIPRMIKAGLQKKEMMEM